MQNGIAWKSGFGNTVAFPWFSVRLWKTGAFAGFVTQPSSLLRISFPNSSALDMERCRIPLAAGRFWNTALVFFSISVGCRRPAAQPSGFRGIYHRADFAALLLVATIINGVYCWMVSWLSWLLWGLH